MHLLALRFMHMLPSAVQINNIFFTKDIKRINSPNRQENNYIPSRYQHSAGCHQIILHSTCAGVGSASRNTYIYRIIAHTSRTLSTSPIVSCMRERIESKIVNSYIVGDHCIHKCVHLISVDVGVCLCAVGEYVRYQVHTHTSTRFDMNFSA